MAKFRSWFEDDNEYSFYYFRDGEYFEDKDCKVYLKCAFLPLFVKFFWKNKEQSTGLLDANKVEIFVGDILKYENKTIYEVRLNPIRSEIALYFEGKIYAFSFGDLRHNLEIVGNIHENMELLNENN